MLDVLSERLYEQIKQISDTRGENRNELFPNHQSHSVCKQVFKQDGGGGKKKGRGISCNVLSRMC